LGNLRKKSRNQVDKFIADRNAFVAKLFHRFDSNVSIKENITNFRAFASCACVRHIGTRVACFYLHAKLLKALHLLDYYC
jgi:hypothetical protein